MAQANTQTSINIPQLLAVALVGFLAIRWFMNKPASPSGSNSSPTSRNNAVDNTKVAQISAMFPQLDQRQIAWDLSRNGGNVAATSERILSGRGLESPPPSYRPQLPAPAPAAPTASGRSSGAAAQQPDLITRYNLQSRVSGKGKEAVASTEEEQKRQVWSSDKAARAEGLRKRREEMVLAARRKMVEKDGGAAGA